MNRRGTAPLSDGADAPANTLDDAPLPDRRLVRAERHEGDARVDSVECVIEEVPVALVYNGISHAVMLASPSDLEDFGLGFSLAEGILESPRELYEVEVEAGEQGIEVRMLIASARFAQLKARRRSLTGRTGCGLCGVDSLAAAVREPAPVSRRQPIAMDAIVRAQAALRPWQDLHRATHAAHAAAWADADGTVQLVREDVGRHNALDKLIGALDRQGIDTCAGFALVTSRASVELVQKAASAGIGLLVAISAPTALAIAVAERSHLSLVGNTRADRLTCYSHGQWLLADRAQT